MRFFPGRKTIRFLLNLKINALLSFIMCLAIASIGRIEKAMTLNSRGLQVASFRTLSSWTILSPHDTGVNYIETLPQPNVVFLEGPPWTKVATAGSTGNVSGRVRIYPARLRYHTPSDLSEGVDATRLYDQVDSSDFPKMERRLWPHHEFDSDCEPMATWQSDVHPVCNEIHAAADIRQTLIDDNWTILSNKGFWRHVWRHRADRSTSTVWKTFK